MSIEAEEAIRGSNICVSEVEISLFLSFALQLHLHSLTYYDIVLRMQGYI